MAVDVLLSRKCQLVYFKSYKKERGAKIVILYSPAATWTISAFPVTIYLTNELISISF